MTTETLYEYDADGRVLRTVAVSEPEYSDLDRGLVLALLAEQRETCPSCGHPMAQCRDPRTMGKWTVLEEICEPSRVLQAAAENAQESKRRGVMLATKRT